MMTSTWGRLMTSLAARTSRAAGGEPYPLTLRHAEAIECCHSWHELCGPRADVMRASQFGQ